jgi:hypothetical protein
MTRRVDPERVAWGMLAGGAAALTAWLVRRLLEVSWKKITGNEPPLNPDLPSVPWRDALVWGGAVGLAAGLSRAIGRRGAAAAWRRAVGTHPPAQ